MAAQPSTLRILWAGLGLVLVGLGALGMFLPLLPTTPFLLLALWCFSRSSPRLEHWLFTHPRFGPPLQRWRAHRVVPVPVKLTAYASMVASLSFMGIVRTPWPILVFSALVMAYGVWFLANCPSQAPVPVSEPGPAAMQIVAREGAAQTPLIRDRSERG